MMQFRAVDGLTLLLGESPVWDERRGQVFIVDIVASRLVALSIEDGGRARVSHEWTFEANVCSLGLCESGLLVIALAREVIFFNPETGARAPLARLDDEPPANRFNDGKVGPDGAFWVGTMDQHTERQPSASLYRITADGGISRRKQGLFTSNGLAWSPDGATLYHADSSGKWLERHSFDVSTGDMGDAVRIASLDEVIGRPDGAAMDAQGFYWSAGVSAGCLNRIAPDGRIVETIALATKAPTMACFCGPDLKTLLVTSHRLISPEALIEYPLSGSVFLASSPVAGSPVSRFKGA